jgi:putative NADH-flavin reductase
MEKNKKIAVIGGTGKAGKYLVNELVKQEFNIRVLLRNPSKFENSSPLIEKVQGNAINYESIYELLNGCDAIISTLGQRKEDELVFSKASGNIVKAMNSLNINRYIVLTGMSIDIPSDKKSFKNKLLSGIMRLCFPAIIADKQKEYSILAESDLNWTIVRVPYIEQSESRRVVSASLIDCPGKKISTADIACFLIEQLNDETFSRKCPFLSN